VLNVAVTVKAESALDAVKATKVMVEYGE